LHTFIRDSSTIVATDVSSASRSKSTSQAVSLKTTVDINQCYVSVGYVSIRICESG